MKLPLIDRMVRQAIFLFAAFWAGLMPLPAGAAGPPPAWAAPDGSPRHAPVQQSDMAVWELMRLDTRLALVELRKRVRAQERAGEAAGSVALNQSGDVRLVAIYGVGKRLLAHLVIGTHPVVFVHGKATPVQNGSPDQGYRLQGISGACVRLVRREQGYTACLSSTQEPG